MSAYLLRLFVCGSIIFASARAFAVIATYKTVNPAYPDVLAWDPVAMRGKSITITTRIFSDHVFTNPVSATIYLATDFTHGANQVIRQLSSDVIVFAANEDRDAILSWDGKKDNGADAPKGLYVFVLSVADISIPYTWSDKWNALIIWSGFSVLTYVGPDGTSADPTLGNLIFRVKYNINTGGSGHADIGWVTVYDPQLKQVARVSLSGPDPNAPWNPNLTDGDHLDVQVKIPKSAFAGAGDYSFVVSAQVNPSMAYPPGKQGLQIGQKFSVNKKAFLTDPVDQDSKHVIRPMTFKGLPDHAIKVNKPAPGDEACPVVLRGYVDGIATERPTLVFTYEGGFPNPNKGNEWTLAEGPYPVAFEEIKPQETGDYQLNFDANTNRWDFQVVWRQKLKRTLLQPLPEAPPPPRTEYWRIWAYAITNSVQKQSLERHIFVTSMARPAQGKVDPKFGEYTEKNRPAPGSLPTLSKATTSGKTIVARFYGEGIPHLAVDFAAAPGYKMNSAESGSVITEPIEFKFEKYTKWGNNGFDPATAQLIWSSMLAWSGGSDARDKLVCVAWQTGVGTNNFNLGPNVEVEHGEVNTSIKRIDGKLDPMSQDIYDKGVIRSKYAHLKSTDGVIADTPIEEGQDKKRIVGVSQWVATTGSWYNGPGGIALNSLAVVNVDGSTPNYLRQPFEQDQARLLSLGYFTITATIYLVHKDNLRKFLVKQQGGGPNTTYVIDHWDGQEVAFPSLTGPHLHFEVRNDSKKEATDLDKDGVVRAFGEQNPHNWVVIPFGKVR